MACNRCKGTSSDPFNFLLSCSECGKNWHHRCHIPPLVDQELTALIRATNDNDVDNGLSSWIGRCCKRKRRTQAMLEIPQPLPRSLFVSADLPADAVHRGSAAPLHGPDSKQTVATPPSDGCVNGDDSFHESVVCAQTTSAQPALRHAGTCTSSALMLPDTVLPHSTPSSARFALPSFNNQPASFAAHESSMTLAGEPSGQLAGSTHVQAPSRLSKHPTSLGGASHTSTKSMSMDIIPPTLDLRALSLNQAPGATKAPSRLFLYHTTTSMPPSSLQPIPPVKSEDDEMEGLYGPPLGLPTLHAPQRQRSLSLRLPAESEPRVLPVLAAKDPHVLAVLEGQERREAVRPRRGMRKAQAVHGAGKKRAGFFLVEGLTAGRAEQKSRWAISRK